MSRMVVVLAWLLVLLAPRPGRAAFHLADIDEINASLGGDSTANYVEVRMLAGGQTIVGTTRLTSFNCDGSVATVLLQVPSNLGCNGALHWSMATASYATATGVTPNYTFTGSIPACGMICWGAPGIITPPDPMTWDPSMPDNYVDCVGYGGYTGTLMTGDAAPSALPPGDGNQSLQRMTDLSDDSTDFALAARTPTRISCPTTTTTSSSTTSTTSSTSTSTTATIPPNTDQTLLGKKLLLLSNADPAKKKVVLLSKDPAATLGGGNSSADDPVVHGGSLRVETTAGDVFDATYNLPASKWSYIGPSGGNMGYKYKDPAQTFGPIKVALVKPGRLVKAVGKGAALMHTLATNPNPVNAVLRTGGKHFCTSFGGAAAPVFTASKKYLAKDAPAPGACPP